MLQTDTITVFDRANETTEETAVTVFYGRIAGVFPKVLFSSRWVPIPYIIYIIGEDTGFNTISEPLFTPDNSIRTIGKISFGNFMAVLVLISSDVEEGFFELADKSITNDGGQEVTFTRDEALRIKLLPFLLDKNQN